MYQRAIEIIFISEFAGFTWLLYYAVLQLIGAIATTYWDRNLRIWAVLLNLIPALVVLFCVLAFNYDHGIRAGHFDFGVVRWEDALYPNLVFELYLLLTFKAKVGQARALVEKIIFVIVSGWFTLVAFGAAAMAFG
jgi:hypothetical protein